MSCAVARHGAEATAEIVVLVGLDVEQLAEAIEADTGTPCSAEHLEDVFAARQRIIVLGQFPLQHRIGATNGGKFAGLFGLATLV